MRSFFTILNLIINSIFIILLLLSAYSSKISPKEFIFSAFLGIGFLSLLVVNIFFIAFWIVKLRWFFLLSSVALLLSYGSISTIFPITRSSKKQIALNDSTQFTLLSYNVKLFDFYKKDKKLDNYNKTLDYIISRDADVVCLQEFGYYNEKGFLEAKNILDCMSKKYNYRHIEYHLNSRQKSTYGVATFSKFPITKKRTVEYDSKYNSTICSELRIKNKTVRLFNCHLESNQLTLDDKKKMFEVIGDPNTENIKGTTGLLLRKVGSAAKKRAHQADAVYEAIEESDSLVIVCGDFNDSPISYTYNRIKGDLEDVFENTSSGLGITYNELPFLFRIDYIFHSSAIRAGNFKIDKVKYSDHYPISCVIDLK